MTTELKPCPFCGKQPDVETDGTFIEINCCCSMNFQKSDYLTMEERDLKNWDSETHVYTDIIEEKVFNIVAKEWNTRAKD